MRIVLDRETPAEQCTSTDFHEKIPLVAAPPLRFSSALSLIISPGNFPQNLRSPGTRPPMGGGARGIFSWKSVDSYVACCDRAAAGFVSTSAWVGSAPLRPPVVYCGWNRLAADYAHSRCNTDSESVTRGDVGYARGCHRHKVTCIWELLVLLTLQYALGEMGIL